MAHAPDIKRFQIEMPTERYIELKELADDYGLSINELIRKAVRVIKVIQQATDIPGARLKVHVPNSDTETLVLIVW